MPKLFKILILPLAMTCCSMSYNATNFEFMAFTLTKDEVNNTITPHAYLSSSGAKNTCFYVYNWYDQDGNKEQIRSWQLSSLPSSKWISLPNQESVSFEKLMNNPTNRFECVVTVGNQKETISLFYNPKGNRDDRIITEGNNMEEISSGYIEESISYHKDHQNLNYHYEDVITFLNFEDLVVNDLYYDFDISFLKFRFKNGKDDFLKGDFRFYFYDKYNLFPDFEINDNLYRWIPLTVNYFGAECYFTFTPQLYYDPETHDCSPIKHENYLSTDNLMFPFHAAKELEHIPCYLELNIDGFIKFKITGTFGITYLKEYYGVCEESEYCTMIHQDEDVNVREQVKEIIL